MDCKQADLLIMQYAEKSIAPSDAKNLTKHLLVCEECRESFLAFDICMDETPIVEVPADFTLNVMARVKAEAASLQHNETVKRELSGITSAKSSRFIQAATGLGTILSGVLLFVALNFGYSGDFLGTLSELVHYYSIALMRLFEGVSINLGGSEHFSRFTFVFVPVLSLFLFVLHSTEKSTASSGDSVEA